MTDETPAVAAGDAPLPAGARGAALGSALVALLTLIAYQPVLTDRGFALLNVDDTRYITDNPRVTSGLTRENVAWALTSLHQSNWHPLTWMSWQLDVQLFGLAPWGFHLTNVILHVANAVLVFLVLYRAAGGWARSATVAALFAVHPLHVESVAWVSERKDVLSTFFCLLAMLAYVAHAARPSVARYLPVVVLFAMGLMAKSMLVTLPCVLLLLDAWPLRRLRTAAQLPRLLAEKLPLFALSAVGAALTLQAQERMMAALRPVPLGARIGNALVYYASYLGRTFWPVGLTPYHPNPGAWLGALPTLGAALVLGAISALCWWTRARRPWLLVGWLWFLGTLVPVIGLVQVGFLATTDHYTYVPHVGFFLMLAWGGHAICASRRWPRVVPGLAAAVAVGACVLLTRHQVGYWRDSVALWQHILDIGPEDAFAHAYLAQGLEAQGRDAEAEEHYATAMRLDTRWKEHEERGLALEASGDLWGARRELETVLLVAPHDVTALEHLAVQFQRRGEIGDALKQYATLARIQPKNAGPEYNLGLLYQQRGDAEQARAHWQRALEIDPTLAEARRALDAPSVGEGR